MPLQAEYIRVRTGIFEPKHVEQLGGGSPWVLYFWIHSQVKFSGRGAGVMLDPYTHKRAADSLGLNENSVKGWFQTLRRLGYISTRATGRGLEVTVENYRPEPRATEPRSAVADSASEPHSAPRKRTSEPRSAPGGAETEPRSAVSGGLGALHTTLGEPHTTPTEPGSAPTAESLMERARDSRDSRDSREGSESVTESKKTQRADHTPDSIRIYCQVRQTSISKAQADVIAKAVPDEPAALAQWRLVVETCEANGIGKGNVKCAIDWHRDGIPPKYRLPQPRPTTPPAEQAAPDGAEPAPDEPCAKCAGRARRKLEELKAGLKTRLRALPMGPRSNTVSSTNGATTAHQPGTPDAPRESDEQRRERLIAAGVLTPEDLEAYDQRREQAAAATRRPNAPRSTPTDQEPAARRRR